MTFARILSQTSLTVWLGLSLQTAPAFVHGDRTARLPERDTGFHLFNQAYSGDTEGVEQRERRFAGRRLQGPPAAASVPNSAPWVRSGSGPGSLSTDKSFQPRMTTLEQFIQSTLHATVNLMADGALRATPSPMPGQA